MNEPKRAVFGFENYKINEFSFREPGVAKDNLSIHFDPSGVYSIKDGKYSLYLKFRAFQEDENSVQTDFITTDLVATFDIGVATFEEIPVYFYRNSIAIVYPYLRAFITTLTVQANVKTLIMPVLNLSELEGPLKEHTTIITE